MNSLRRALLGTGRGVRLSLLAYAAGAPPSGNNSVDGLEPSRRSIQSLLRNVLDRASYHRGGEPRGHHSGRDEQQGGDDRSERRPYALQRHTLRTDG